MLHNGTTTEGYAVNSEGKSQAEVSSAYTTLMNNNVHLYTKWHGSTTDASGSYTANSWVEFRIIQVGEHSYTGSTGDGSAITFMATHTLPMAEQMSYPDDTNSGGWAESYLRGWCNGTVLSNLPNLSGSILSVNKYNARGSNTSDKIWCLSYSELTGATYPNKHPYTEGSQYSWFVGRVTSSDGDNPAIANNNLTRAGNKPYHGDGDNFDWWTRSAELNNNDSYCRVLYTGKPNVTGGYNNARFYRGTVICFAM